MMPHNVLFRIVEGYYYSVPFVLSNVTPAFFVQTLVELYDKALAGEPPALAYDEEWHKVEMSVEQEPEFLLP